MKSPLIIGHRGASAVAPENTMAAFRKALAAGADGIEFDVRLTSDDVAVVIHDSTLRRTGRLPYRVADLAFAEIAKIDVGSWFAATFAKETVPSLAELFALFESNDSMLYLEMKCDAVSEYQSLAEACVRLIDEYSLRERVMVECFQLEALRVLKEIDPRVKTAALFEPAFKDPSLFVALTKEVGAEAIALHHRLAREGLVRKAKAEGLHVAVWTVDETSWVQKARAMGIDALITNDPERLVRARSR
jgi:glycerophosphoryl diester phosphodiesterase